ncbi:peptidyl-tRNA hydrolase [Polychytrium aggregatum]|uniref:peptidyl-tRNA hydrolase n=1 Tax=Polychytrium aggregatum TaxID=110093 RepID=UPI0022FE9152|nr:peptidyl-tRNA hydrolase [Polychytrium aggregatum]KAI9207395.1 peptidyl-tRNA hydrolase [Polychytrium aggregatum]
MTKGKIAAQCCHSTLANYKSALRSDPKSLRAWEERGQAKVTLKCNSESEMIELQRHARALKLVANITRDAGKTQIAAGTQTVLAIGPGPASVVDKVTGHLKLY